MFYSRGESAFDEGKPMLSLQTGRAYGKELHRKSPKRWPPVSTRARLLAELGMLKLERPKVPEKANHDKTPKKTCNNNLFPEEQDNIRKSTRLYSV